MNTTSELRELHASGSFKLSDDELVDELTGQNASTRFWVSCFWFILFFSLMSAVFALTPDRQFAAAFAGGSMVISVVCLLRLRQITRSQKTASEDLANENRGRFSPVTWRIDEDGVHYNMESPNGYCRGLQRWNYFDEVKTTDTLAILLSQLPRGYTVLVRDWFASDEDWEAFLSLANERVIPQSDSLPA